VAKMAGGLGAEMPRAPMPPDKPPDRTEKEERNRRLAWRLWTAARDPRGTLVERYLRSRRLDLPPAPVLRFHPRCRNKESGNELPAMLARVDGPDGEFIAVHRTWLRPDGSGKAELREPKWSLGPTRGGAVRLAPAGPELAIAEGIENTLTVMLMTGLPGWSALSAPGIRALLLPAAVGTVVIAADNDKSGVGEGAARAAAESWLWEGRQVRLMLPSEAGSDFNDELLRGKKTHGQRMGR
jgi:putative DNA primase/helicase